MLSTSHLVPDKPIRDGVRGHYPHVIVILSWAYRLAKRPFGRGRFA